MQRQQAERGGETGKQGGLTFGVESCRMRTAGGWNGRGGCRGNIMGSKVAYIARGPYFDLSCRCRYPKPHGGSGGGRGKRWGKLVLRMVTVLRPF